jgi:hypothetical protein
VNESPWMTVPEAAAYARRDPQTIATACRNKTLPASQKMRKGKWLINRDVLDAWIRGDLAEQSA